jgi:hypothetical protein
MSEGATALAQQHLRPRSDIDIAQAAEMRPIGQVARDKPGIPDGALYAFGPHKAKLPLDYDTASPPTPTAKARRAATLSRCASCGSRLVRNSSWRSAATS